MAALRFRDAASAAYKRPMTDASTAAEPMSAAQTGDLASRGTAQSLALGFETLEGACAMRAPFRPELAGDPADGGLAGGVITTLLDQTCGMAVGFAARAGVPATADHARMGGMATLDFRIDFIRPARAGCDVVGEAECYRLVGGLGFVRGLAYEDDPADPIAAVQAAFMLTEPPAGA
jgi:acyl-coenzyme A thioesterase PaaI-like protein